MRRFKDSCPLISTAMRETMAIALAILFVVLFMSLGTSSCFADEDLAPLVPPAPTVTPDLGGTWTVIGGNGQTIEFTPVGMSGVPSFDVSGSFYDADTEDATISFDANFQGWTAQGTWSDSNGEKGTCKLDAAPFETGAFTYSETLIKGTFHKTSNDSDNYYEFVRYPDLTVTASGNTFTVTRPEWNQDCIMPVLFNLTGSASYGVDYSSNANVASGTAGAVMKSGQTSTTITVTPLSAEAEGKTVQLTLKPANPVASSATESGTGWAMPNYNVGSPGTATVTLGGYLEPNPYNTNNSPQPSFEAAVNVTVNGKALQSDTAPYINSAGYTMLPIKACADALGASVQWDGATQTAALTQGENTFAITIGQSSILYNGHQIPIPTAAVIQDGHTFLPLHVVGMMLGAQVNWDASTRTVSITTK